jgi:hypothetical protein
VQRSHDTAFYALRNWIEHFFNKLKNARPFVTCYDKLPFAFSALFR